MRQCPAYSRGPDNLQFVSVKYIHCYLKITGGIGVIKNLKDQYLKTSASKTKTKFWLNTAKKKIISVNYPLKHGTYKYRDADSNTHTYIFCS